MAGAATSADGEANMFAAYAPRDGAGGEGGVIHPPLELEIGPAERADIESMAHLLAWREGISRSDAVERVNKILAGGAAGAGQLCLVARSESRVVGFGRAEFVPTKPAPYEHVPPGWYLVGLIVDAAHRRRGIGLELTGARLAWIRQQRASEAYYFANSLNLPTIDLHARLGFREIVRGFKFPRATFSGGGAGVLFRAAL